MSNAAENQFDIFDWKDWKVCPEKKLLDLPHAGLGLLENPFFKSKKKKKKKKSKGKKKWLILYN